MVRVRLAGRPQAAGLQQLQAREQRRVLVRQLGVLGGDRRLRRQQRLDVVFFVGDLSYPTHAPDSALAALIAGVNMLMWTTQGRLLAAARGAGARGMRLHRHSRGTGARAGRGAGGPLPSPSMAR